MAQIKLNHECSIAKAKKMIRFAKLGGANAVKFQTYKASCFKKFTCILGRKRKLLVNISFFQSMINLRIKIIRFYKNIAKKRK